MGNFLKNLIIPRYNNNYFPYVLRKKFLAVVTVGVLLFNLMTAGGQLTIFAGEISSSRLIELANQERLAAGLGQLKPNAQLANAAQAKANNMFQLQYWSHYGPNGETPWQFIIAAGYNYVFAGENLAKGFSSSEAVHSAWMASQTHRENIMKSNYQDVGIAVVEGNLLGTNVVLVVQMFGALTQSSQPASPLPTPQQLPQQPEQTPPPIVNENIPLEEPFVEISTPENDSKLSDPRFTMSGRTNPSADRVIVEDGDDRNEGSVGEDGIWDYRPVKEWTEGSHNVKVWSEDRTVSSSVAFEIDTTPPSIEADSLTVIPSTEENMIEISINIDSTAETALLVAGERSMSLEKKSDNDRYSLSVRKDEVVGFSPVKVVSVDDVGNVSELEITTQVSPEVLGNSTSSTNTSLVDRIQNLSTSDVAKLVTRGVVVSIALFLIIDAVYLYKLNIIHTRGKSLFPMALWILLMTIGIIVGRGGNIL